MAEYTITDPARMHRGTPRAGTPTKSLREKLRTIAAKARLKRMTSSAWDTEYRIILAKMVQSAAGGETTTEIEGQISGPVQHRLSITDNIGIEEIGNYTHLCWK